MKSVIFSLLMLSVVPVFASGVSEAEKREACATVQAIIPTEVGSGLSVDKCLVQFQFDVLVDIGGAKAIEMIGQTIEDMATVCNVTLVKLPYEVAAAKPSCRLE